MWSLRVNGNDLPTRVDARIGATGRSERWFDAGELTDCSVELTTHCPLASLGRKSVKVCTVILEVQANHAVHSCPLPASMRVL